jgi:hypothetical protein
MSCTFFFVIINAQSVEVTNLDAYSQVMCAVSHIDNLDVKKASFVYFIRYAYTSDDDRIFLHIYTKRKSVEQCQIEVDH